MWVLGITYCNSIKTERQAIGAFACGDVRKDSSKAKRHNRSTTKSLNIHKYLNKEISITSLNNKNKNKNSINAGDIPMNEHPVSE
jgi:hypothetical protein